MTTILDGKRCPYDNVYGLDVEMRFKLSTLWKLFGRSHAIQHHMTHFFELDLTSTQHVDITNKNVRKLHVDLTLETARLVGWAHMKVSSQLMR